MTPNNEQKNIQLLKNIVKISLYILLLQVNKYLLIYILMISLSETIPFYK